MKRLLLLFMCGAYTAAFALPTASDKKPDKPNILWITCEDMSPHLGSYGEKVAKTPHLDQLAREGVRFTRAYTTAGVCAPSRAAIITGMYQTSIGAQHMRTLKTPVSPKTPKVPFYSAVIPEQARCFPELLRANGYYCTNNVKQDYQFEAPVTVWDENSNKADWRGRATGQPFFSVINLMTTHESQVFSRDKEPLQVDPAQVEIPPFLPDNPIVRKDYARFLTNVQIMDQQVGEILARLKKDGLYDNTIIFFFSDHGDGLPNTKREIYHRGLHVPLIVRYPGARNAGTTDQTLLSFVDLAPSVLSLAGVPIPAYMQGQAFLGTKKSTNPRRYIFAARDRMDSETDRVRTVSDRRYQYLRNYMPELPYYQNIQYRLGQQSMKEILRLRDAGELNENQMRWFRTSKPAEELFDTEADPYEFVDLAQDPKYAAKLNELRAEHIAWTKKYGDMGAVPEQEMVAGWWHNESKAPITAGPQITSVNGKVTITSATKGASIGYKFKQTDKSWKVYTDPIVATGDSLYVVAHRIGFEPSEVIARRIAP